MHTWHWQTWNNGPYLTCSLLSAWPHGFFTQHFWPQSPEDLVAGLQTQAQVFRVKQVHGNQVLTPSEVQAVQTARSQAADREPDTVFPEADGLLTEKADQAVWVCTADCTPVLIADVATGQVAAIHAGWRGTAQKIVPQAIARLQAQGSRIENLRVAMGPAITGSVYQVSREVAAEVGSTTTVRPDPVAALHGLENAPILPDSEPGRVRLDVRRINALQLEQLGVESEQIAIAPHCTYQQPEHFFSYRRDRQKKVQWSGIVSQSRS